MKTTLTGKKQTRKKPASGTTQLSAGTRTPGSKAKPSTQRPDSATLPTPPLASCSYITSIDLERVRTNLNNAAREVQIARVAIGNTWMSAEHEALSWAQHFITSALDEL